MTARSDLRALLRRARLRYRRPIAALLAGLAAIVAISAMRPSAPTVTAGTPDPVAVSRPGDVTVPVPLSTGGGTVTAGDVVDLVAVDDLGEAQIIADRVTVIEPAGSSGYSSDTVVLITMQQHDALAVTAAAGRGPLSVLIHADAARPNSLTPQ